ncbi:MAG: cysteine synthase A [Erysipelotrichales bacterium]|nr:cysteine synthase A [Erysipelotrichales bacterium]
MIYQNIDQLIGNTPLLRLKKIEEMFGLKAQIVAKLESFNPGGSVKDRIALAMINDAESKGLLKQGSVLIEPTSGNTGIGLALIAATRNYRLILTMPDTMSVERIQMLKAYGTEVVLTEGKKGMTGAIEKAKELLKIIPDSVMPSQFTNLANPEVHFNNTGPEIWKNTRGKIDFLVSGVGTGGTITGAGRYLKDLHPNIKLVAVEPANSPVISKGQAGPHKIQGIGAGFIPEILDTSLIDEVITITDDEAYQFGRILTKKEGVFAGISAGAALAAAVEIAKKNPKKRIVVIIPDSGNRYLSTPLFDY